MSRLRVLLAAAVLLVGPLGAAAQEVLTLNVGDPARRDSRSALVLDGIVDTRTDEVLTPDGLPARLAGTRLLLVGETHTSAEAHRVQEAVIRALVESGRTVIIGLEMYPYTAQPYLDQWVEGLLTEKGFLQLSRWYDNWGYNWGYYRPIFDYARRQGIGMVAVNTPRPVVSAVREKGFDGLTDEEARHIPPRIDTDNEDHLRLFRAYMGPPGSGHEVSEDALFSMFSAQCTWDATMAYNAVSALERHPDAIMVVLVGSGHVSYGLGIQRQAELWFDGTVQTLIPVPVVDEAGAATSSVQSSYADFVWGVAAENSTLYPTLGFSTRQAEPHEPVEIIIVPADSAAARAGVTVGDVMLAIDGTRVPDRETMNRLVADKSWGDRIVFTLERDRERRDVEMIFRR